jgi:hypothetical protein
MCEECVKNGVNLGDLGGLIGTLSEMTAAAELAAELSYEVERAITVEIDGGEFRAWKDRDPAKRVEDVEAVLRCAVGIAISGDNTPEKQHAAWMADRIAAGWTYGEQPDEKAKTHPALVKYCYMPKTQRSADAAFFAIVKVLLHV